jgi:ketosteroid isomerase-like protein
MSATDVERVREAFAAFEQGGVEGLIPHFHPEFEGVVPPELSLEPDTYSGHDGVRRYFALWDEGVTGVLFAPEEIIETDGAIVIRMRITGRGRESGVPLDWGVVNRLTMRDGLIVTMTAYPTLEEALEA